MPQPLTDRQQQVLDFITAYLHRHGYPPSVRDLQAEFSIRSPNGVASHLRLIERKGWIVRDRFVVRGIRLAGQPAPHVEARGQCVLLKLGAAAAELTLDEARDLARRLWDAAAQDLAG